MYLGELVITHQSSNYSSILMPFENKSKIRLKDGIQALFDTIVNQSWKGSQTSVAYDTAWGATLKTNTNKPLFPNALTWLKYHQHSDGSWGSDSYNVCERLVSTAAAVGTFLEYKNSSEIVNKGLNWIKTNLQQMNAASKKLTRPVGFELIFPTLLRRISEQDKQNIFNTNIESILQLQKKKLDRLPIKQMLRGKTPVVFSLEFLEGWEDLPSLDHQISNNFSLGCSPSTTAWYANQNPKTKPGLLYYLQQTQHIDGGWPVFSDYELMNIPFSLYPISRGIGHIPTQFRPIIHRLYNYWTPWGISFSPHFAIPDADDTILGLYCLYEQGFVSLEGRFWQSIDMFEEQNSFKTYEFELEPSLMVNLHALELFLKAKDHPRRQEVIDKLVAFLESQMKRGYLGADKYHNTPSYQNCNGIFAFSEIAPDLAEKCYQYFEQHLLPNGLWEMGSTAIEETSYAVLAMSYYHQYVEPIDLEKLKPSVDFLLSNWTISYAEEWITKVQYSPIEIIQAQIFAALVSYSKAHGMNFNF